MLTTGLTRPAEPTELKGPIISDPVTLAERLEAAIATIEAGLARREAENARLRRIESAAAAALADLDVLIDGHASQRKYG